MRKKIILTLILLAILFGILFTVIYFFIPHFTIKNMNNLPHGVKEIQAYSSMVITGTYDNNHVNAKNIDSTVVVLFDKYDTVTEMLIKEVGYTKELSEKEYYRLHDFKNLYCDIQIHNINTISYTSVLYKGKTKNDIKKFFNAYRNVNILEI